MSFRAEPRSGEVEESGLVARRHMHDKTYWVYILSSHTRVLYVGVTNDIVRRLTEHRAGAVAGFTSTYKTSSLVFIESTNDVHAAIAREKQIKNWTRAKKMRLIESMNPGWRDLSLDG